jgi:uncharacterized membrane protein
MYNPNQVGQHVPMTNHPTPAPKRSGAAGPVLWAATVTMGLTAGTFFAFSVGTMPGLAKTDDHSFVVAMQAINDKIQNPAFFAAFFGTFFLSIAAVILQYRLRRRGAVAWALGGLALYFIGLAVTIGVNIPLNDALAAVDPAHADLAAARQSFEGPWDAANNVRTLVCTAAVICLARAMTLHGRAK